MDDIHPSIELFTDSSCFTVATLQTMKQDLESSNLSLNEATDLAENRPLWRLMSMFGAMHS